MRTILGLFIAVILVASGCSVSPIRVTSEPRMKVSLCLGEVPKMMPEHGMYTWCLSAELGENESVGPQFGEDLDFFTKHGYTFEIDNSARYLRGEFVTMAVYSGYVWIRLPHGYYARPGIDMTHIKIYHDDN